MTRQLAEYILMQILTAMKFLEPYLNAPSDTHQWNEAKTLIEMVVFKDLPGDEAYG